MDRFAEALLSRQANSALPLEDDWFAPLLGDWEFDYQDRSGRRLQGEWYFRRALDGMASALQKEYGGLPMLFAGGVMSNRLIREALTEKYGAVFAEPAFSSDNAAGIAVLTEMKRCGAC